VTIAVLVSLPLLASGLTVEGNHYPKTVTIEGKSLRLVGAGLREKWWFDVYSMGVYSQSGNCNPAALINTDEVKYLRLDMLRDVDAEKMASTIGESFAEHMPKNAPAELKKQRKTFESYFKEECKEKTVLKFIYVPGTGVIMKQNKKKLGPPLTGKAFMQVLWDIYFGKDTCCEDLKEQVLESCKKK
jgi:hypothetical protein